MPVIICVISSSSTSSLDRRLHRTARLVRRQRLFDDRPRRVAAGQQRRNRLPDAVGAERRLHRRVAEEQLARRVEERHRVFEVLDRHLQVGLLAGQRRAIGRELLADGVEERPELAELVARRQIERHAELAAPEPGETAADDVNRPQQALGQHTGHEDRDDQSATAAGHERRRRASRRAPRASAAWRRRRESIRTASSPSDQRLPHFERPARRSRSPAAARRRCWRQSAPGPRSAAAAGPRARVAAGDDDRLRVEDRRVRHALAVERSTAGSSAARGRRAGRRRDRRSPAPPRARADRSCSASILPRDEALAQQEAATAAPPPGRSAATTDSPTMAVTPAICFARIPRRMARLVQTAWRVDGRSSTARVSGSRRLLPGSTWRTRGRAACSTCCAASSG